MKRLYTVLSLIALLAVLAMPAIARADDVPPPPEQSQPAELAPDGWTWDESSPLAAPDGWTWDETSSPLTTEGWTWDEA
jgi:hypothetical protein